MDEKNQDSIGYAFKGRIMISSVVLLFIACSIIVIFHVYSRCWFRRRVHHHSRRLLPPSTAATVISPRGLDPTAINSLPAFIYESKNQESPLECAVCLSEFDDNEAGRILPECNHCFHVDCIDMWLQSHCDCPLCRARVEGQPAMKRAETIEDPFDGVVSITVLEDMNCGSGSGLNRTAQSEGIHWDCSSRELTNQIDQHPTKSEEDPDPIPDGNIGPVLESGPRTPARSARGLE